MCRVYLFLGKVSECTLKVARCVSKKKGTAANLPIPGKAAIPLDSNLSLYVGLKER